MRKQKIQNPLKLLRTMMHVNSFLIPKKYRKELLLVLGLETITNQSWLLATIIWSQVLDLLTGKNIGTSIDILVYLIIGYQGVTVLRNLINSRKNIIENKMRAEMSQYVDTLLVKKHIEWEKFDKENPESRELIDHALINFQNSVEAFFEQKRLLQNLITFCIAIIGIMFIKWWYMAIAILSVIPYMIFSYKRNQKHHERTKRISESKRYQRNIKENLLDDFVKIGGKINLLLPKSVSGLHWSKKIDHLFFISMNKNWWLLSLFGMTITGFVLFDLTKNTILGIITLGTLNLAFNYFGRISETLFSLSDSIIRLFKILPGIEDFLKFLNFKSSMEHKENAVVIPIKEKMMIEFRNVSFRYPTQKEDTWAIKNVSFVITDGEHIGIIGENGSGKSTIVQLLLRLYDPTEGAIFINGINLKDIDREKYHEHFGVLEQNFKTLSGMFQNVIRGEKRFDEKKIVYAMKSADIYEKIMSYEDGYMANYGSIFKNGIRFSGGERQKLAYASVVYRNPNIILLDEPTSAMSPLAEQRVFERYNKTFFDKTLILISHRFKSLDHVNRVLLFDKGILIGDGSHENLMISNTKYKDMFLASIPEKYQYRNIPELMSSIH